MALLRDSAQNAYQTETFSGLHTKAWKSASIIASRPAAGDTLPLAIAACHRVEYSSAMFSNVAIRSWSLDLK